MLDLRRRQFIARLGGTAAAWPLAARTQQADRMRRIGLLIQFAESDPNGQARVAAFQEGLQKLGWRIGDNLRIDTRMVPIVFTTVIEPVTQGFSMAVD